MGTIMEIWSTRNKMTFPHLHPHLHPHPHLHRQSASASASAPPMPQSSSSQSVENEEMSHMGLMDPRPPPSPLLVKDKENVNDVNHRIDAMERRINETIRKTKVNHNKGIISTLVSRKRDALKLLSLSLMILLAISMHSFFEYCIKDYMMNSFVDPQKERTIRVMYPIVVFLSYVDSKGHLSMKLGMD